MKRDEIAELADDARVASNAYPDMEVKVPAPMLAELCRVWLAVDSAPEVTADGDGYVSKIMAYTDAGQTFRLVPLATGGESNAHD